MSYESIPLSSVNYDTIAAVLAAVEQLREEVEMLSKPASRQGLWLSDYLLRAAEIVQFSAAVETDPFYLPCKIVRRKIESLLELEPQQINSAFSTCKVILLAALKRYAKNLHRGFRQLRASPSNCIAPV